MRFVLLVIFLLSAFVLQIDAQSARDSSISSPPAATAVPKEYKNVYRPFLDSNLFLRSGDRPQALPVIAKKKSSNLFFYVIAGLLLFLGIIKTIYSRYFNTLFRVFFNTSLRQNQLTDQLEQARIPSLIFNLFFVISAGLYVFLLLRFFSNGDTEATPRSLAARCIPAVACCYAVKYLSLRFTGWVTNYTREARTYIFIIFLLNKVIGILLLPFIIILLFSAPAAAPYAVVASIIMLSVILLVRFFRSWSLLQSQLKITGFHFFLYILSLEVLPIALIYKAVMLFLGKSP